MPGDYDVIIIGSGAGGGTLARQLASTGKRILILERGDWLKREALNWDAKAVFVDNRYLSADTWYDDNGKPFQPQIHYFVGGATKMYGAALYGLRREDFGELREYDGIAPAWPIGYDEMEPYYTKAEQMYQVRELHGMDPTEPPSSAPYPYPPVSNEPRIQPQQGFVSANELHVPVSDPKHPTPTHITLLSADTDHSFWVPRLAGKTDLIPNRTNSMWIDPHETGVYLGQCAQEVWQRFAGNWATSYPQVRIVLGPGFVESALLPLCQSQNAKRAAEVLVRPKFALLPASAALVGWHIPIFFALGMQSAGWHLVEHLSFLATDLMWTCVTIVYLVAGAILTMRLLSPKGISPLASVKSRWSGAAIPQSISQRLEVP